MGYCGFRASLRFRGAQLALVRAVAGSARAGAAAARSVLGADAAEQRGVDVVDDRRVVAQVLGRVLDRLSQAVLRVVAVDLPVCRPVVEHAVITRFSRVGDGGARSEKTDGGGEPGDEQ